jgi:hypothetical protein
MFYKDLLPGGSFFVAAGRRYVCRMQQICTANKAML